MFEDRDANLSFMYLLSEYMWLFIIILASNSIKINNDSEPETIYVQPEQLVYLEPEAENQIGFLGDLRRQFCLVCSHYCV